MLFRLFKTRTATVHASWEEIIVVIGTVHADVLPAITAVETLLLCDSRTLRIISCPLPPILLPLVFHWSLHILSKVPETKKKK